MTDVNRQVDALLRDTPPGTPLWVALSGGLDSSVLLHALAGRGAAGRIRAVHVHHGLSDNADAWQAHCEQLCAALGVVLTVRKVSVQAQGKGLESAARDARYRVFESLLTPGALLLTGHHADDQAETLLLRLLRGSGLRGLAAMHRTRPLGQGLVVRPLLTLPRSALRSYADTVDLRWVEDESNRDTAFDRNYLRQRVMPVLAERWPDFARRWQRTSAQLAEAQTLLDDLAAIDLQTLEPRPERLGQSLRADGLCALTQHRRTNVLRYWFAKQGLAIPERVHLAALRQQLLEGSTDSEALVEWGDAQAGRHRDRLVVWPRAQRPAPWPEGECVAVANQCDQTLVLPSGGELECEFRALVPPDPVPGSWLRADLPDLHVRGRIGGERCQPSGRAHSQRLKNLLQEHALAPWLRPSLPLIYSGEQLVAVADLWLCRGFEAAPGAPGYRLHWRAGRNF
ncbi:tRNA lysidine(34) synthetase TilS [Marinimicrobium alkaliphilum]|uniref:tRNA lysidine(34) synthetase TilS n=1 Tax=Marinimicrobium alkaliphilum TaxID=2202654 RepID=UPI0018E08849|nr:tRNA lysidine(34) synthetase TilS [Marinimicrobium alkaliphilum]